MPSLSPITCTEYISVFFVPYFTSSFAPDSTSSSFDTERCLFLSWQGVNLQSPVSLFVLLLQNHKTADCIMVKIKCTRYVLLLFLFCLNHPDVHNTCLNKLSGSKC